MWDAPAFPAQVKFQMSADTTLADLLQLNLHKYEDEVRNIVDQAVKESGMEKVPFAHGDMCLVWAMPKLVRLALHGGPAPTEHERQVSWAFSGPTAEILSNISRLDHREKKKTDSSCSGSASRPEQPARFKAPGAPSCPAAPQPVSCWPLPWAQAVGGGRREDWLSTMPGPLMSPQGHLEGSFAIQTPPHLTVVRV